MNQPQRESRRAFHLHDAFTPADKGNPLCAFQAQGPAPGPAVESDTQISQLLPVSETGNPRRAQVINRHTGKKPVVSCPCGIYLAGNLHAERTKGLALKLSVRKGMRPARLAVIPAVQIIDRSTKRKANAPLVNNPCVLLLQFAEDGFPKPMGACPYTSPVDRGRIEMSRIRIREMGKSAAT